MADTRKKGTDGGEVVYRRLPETERVPNGDDAGIPLRSAANPRMNLAPSLKQLLVGFVLLLVLIGLLGYLSRRELDNVESGTSLFEKQYTSEIGQLLNLYAAAIRLDSEARIRSAAELRGELTPPLEVPIGNAREEVEGELKLLARMPFAKEESWRVLRERLTRFVETTKDLRAFSLDGFAQFRDFRAQVEIIETELAREPVEVSRRIDALRAQSVRRVTFLWITSLLIGLIVIGATIWEVQRRFLREQESLEEARRERQFSTQTLEGMVSAVAAVDAHAHLRSANAAFFKLFPTLSVGDSLYNSRNSPEAQRILEIAVSQREATAGYRGRWPLVSGPESGATSLTCDLYTSPLEIDSEQGQIITLVDVSDSVKTETMLRRSEALAAVGQASAQVAHEIRNPLGSIRLGVSMLREMTGSEEAVKTIDLVERGIDHLTKLVVDVTQFSREKPLERSRVELQHLLNASLELVADKIRDKQQHIEKRFSKDDITGTWDEVQLRQVFVNLLANAIDASKKDGIVTIATELTISEQAHLSETGEGRNQASTIQQQIARVVIIDQGEGMDEQTRLRIFEPFFTTKKRGTGLGLAIVKQVVERHGGSITVQSEPGKGAQVIIEMPTQHSEMKRPTA